MLLAFASTVLPSGTVGCKQVVKLLSHSYTKIQQSTVIYLVRNNMQCADTCTQLTRYKCDGFYLVGQHGMSGRPIPFFWGGGWMILGQQFLSPGFLVGRKFFSSSFLCRIFYLLKQGSGLYIFIVVIAVTVLIWSCKATKCC